MCLKCARCAVLAAAGVRVSDELATETVRVLAPSSRGDASNWVAQAELVS